MIAAKKADVIPTHDTSSNAGGDIVNTGNNLATKKTPATTMVAACINAETGVGPSIASGNQMCKGNIALFPAPPINTKTNPHVNAEIPRNDAATAFCNSPDPGVVSLSISVLKSNVPE